MNARITPDTLASSFQPVHGRRGFTLLEILVALGAVIVVAVGLATIFRSVGDTVSAGRRLSRVNQVSKLLEQQLRTDFGTISRDGFLAIRQQYADRNGDGVLQRTGNAADVIPLFVGQEADRQRLRRIDEVIFFRKGSFETQRPSLSDETWRAKSDEAMLYYGHGQQRRTDDTDNVEQPKVNDTNQAEQPNNEDLRLGRRPDPGNLPNPNLAANSWSLLRNVTLLVPLNTSEGVLPTVAIYDIPANDNLRKRDKECQIAGQPAAASIFRGINRGSGPETPNRDLPFGEIGNYAWYSDQADGIADNYNRAIGANFTPSPNLASGLVDIATTSLAEIRSQVLGYADTRIPAAPPADVGFSPIIAFPGELGLISPAFPAPGSTFSFSPVGSPPNSITQRPSPYESVDYMHAWMSNAFPGRAAAANNSDQFELDGVGFGSEDAAGIRPRYSASAERLYDLLARASDTTNSLSAVQSRNVASILADRRMLQSSVLLASCTEFIVEWSFGETDLDGSVTGTPGTTIWYGPRENPLPPPAPNRDGVFGYYKYNPQVDEVGHIGTAVQRRDGTIAPDHHPVSNRLIYGYDLAPGANDRGDEDGSPISITSYFGYLDPTFNPSLDLDADNTEPEDAAQTTMPWRWPSMIRVRATIADPIDPSIETTFEYVFSVPSN